MKYTISLETLLASFVAFGFGMMFLRIVLDLSEALK